MMHYEVAEVPYVKLAGDLGGLLRYFQSRCQISGGWCGSEDAGIRKVVELADAVEEVESCNCLLRVSDPGIEMLKEEGLLRSWMKRSASDRGIVVKRECLVWDIVPVSFRIMWRGVRRWRGIYMSF